MLIPDATIKEILDKADIVAIIGEHIHLEKKGNDYKGICPFHDDSNPSLSVSPSRKIYKCFSCGASGNAITFIQHFKHVSFVEAVKYVGSKCGVVVKTGEVKENKNKKLYDAMEEACNYYEFYLRNSIEGQDALKYLHNRKLADDVIKRFRIGLASKENDLLFNTLTKKEENPILPIDLIRCGLIRSIGNDKYTDVFKERVIFPITNLDGEVVGFSGRIYNKQKDENTPKYMNTSENDIFKKGQILYNYSYAMNDIKVKNRIYIFEGFMDVIAAYRANVLNTVATMGTALTHDHIKAIKKLTSNIVLCFDGDSAGINATRRSINIFVKEGMDVKVMLLPKGMDPDEYLDQYGSKALHDFLENKPISSFDYLYQLERRNLNLDSIDSVNSFKNNIFAYIRLLNSRAVNEKVFNIMANDLMISADSIAKDFDNYVKTTKETVEVGGTNVTDLPEIKKVNKKVPIKKTKYINSEQSLIYFAIKKKSYCTKVASLLPFDKNQYVDRLNRDIFWAVHDYYRINNEMDYEKFYNSLILTDKMRSRLDVIMSFPTLCDDTLVFDLLKECAMNVIKYSNEKELKRLNEVETKSLQELESLKELKQRTTRFVGKNEE